jgi:ABC-type antimicrobial peptide transport system permease subunit
VKKFDDYTQIDFRIPDSDTEFRDSIFKNFSPDSVFLIYPYSSRFADNIDRLSMGFVEAYTIPFFSLDSIERFQEYAYREPLSLNVDMNTVESKKNFQIFSNVAQALAFFLSVIAIVLISSYNFSLLVSHINRNKKNLGTLKAFGLGNHVIIGIYSTVSFLLVSLGFCLCFAFLGFCGNALVSLFMKFGLFPFNKGEIFYDMWSFFDAFFVFVFLPVGVLFMKLYLFIHKATPGDLIFGR